MRRTVGIRRGARLAPALVLAALAAASEGAPRTAAAPARPTAGPASASPGPPSSAWLSLLPDGEVKRRFVLDCTGCHQLDERIAFAPEGRARTREEWREAVARMLSYAGADTSFPVISAEREPAATADWLAEHLVRRPPEAPAAPPMLPAGARVEELDVPVAEGLSAPEDLPHDLAVLPDGRIAVTGMFSHRIWVLDPRSGTFTAEPIPVEAANPRAIETDASGSWYVLLGMPQAVARRDGRTGEWTVWRVGMYPHSVAVDPVGRVWFNGHFTKAPPRLGFVEPATGAVRTFAAPSGPADGAGGPIPYGLRVAPDGTLWGTELAGNRLVGLDPASGRFRTFTLPTAHSGPRRPDFDAEGVLWVPEYAANRLARFDPADGSFRELELPIPDALPYVVRVDRARGRVWIGTGAADAVLAYEPASERFTVYPLPTRGALVRHLDVEEATGAVWVAYGQSPGGPARIARVTPAATPAGRGAREVAPERP